VITGGDRRGSVTAPFDYRGLRAVSGARMIDDRSMSICEGTGGSRRERSRESRAAERRCLIEQSGVLVHVLTVCLIVGVIAVLAVRGSMRGLNLRTALVWHARNRRRTS
jgi:hypothetical protein